MSGVDPDPAYAWWQVRRWGCLGWIIAAGCLLLAGVLVLIVWYRSDADLREVDQRAKQLGIPSDWSGMHLGPRGGQPLEDWRRIMQLSSALRTYPDVNLYVQKYKIFQVDGPLDESVRRHHGGQPEATIAEVGRLLRDLKPGSVIEAGAEARFREAANDARRGLISWYAERILIADDAELTSLVQQSARLIMAQPCCRWWDMLIATSDCRLWRTAIIRRLAISKGPHESVVLTLETVADWLLQNIDPCYQGECIRLRLLAASWGADDGTMDSGRIWASDHELGPAVRFLYRSGRSRAVLMNMDAWLAYRSQTNFPLAVQAANRIWQSMGRSLVDIPRNYWTSLHGWSEYGLMAASREITTLRSVAAFHRGAPWPVDTGDPAGKPVRPIVRDGQVIGFYVLFRGIDHGGHSRRDLCVALTQPLGSPMAADPYVPPKAWP